MRSRLPVRGHTLSIAVGEQLDRNVLDGLRSRLAQPLVPRSAFDEPEPEPIDISDNGWKERRTSEAARALYVDIAQQVEQMMLQTELEWKAEYLHDCDD